MADDVDLVALEREGWEALTAGRGAEYYREHLAENALMAFGFGVLDRQAAIEAMAQAPPWGAFEIIDPQVVKLTDDSGIVVYRADAQRPGQERYSAVISSTYACRAGRWLLAFHQQTPA